jgi:hypothetical protein
MDKKHSKKEVREAIEYAKSKGWRIQLSSGSGHAWGQMYCPYNDKDCRCGEFCIASIWSTPRSPVSHARQIRKVVDKCIGGEESRRTER